MNKNNILEIKNLVKNYANFKLDNLNLELKKGTIVGLIGENGAGKTTLIKAILKIIKTDKGEIMFNINEDNKQEDIGVVLDNMFFPDILTPKDINTIMKSIYHKWDSNLYNKYLQDFGLDSNQVIKKMSKGMQKKLEIATALSHHPKFLILDEPTSGLDPLVRTQVLDLLLDFIQDEEKTVLFSTHITSDLEHIADEIIFINEGKIILNKSRDDILDNYGILKCSLDEWQDIASEDIITYQKNKYGYEVLVNNKNKIKKKYANLVIDNITLEELMILMLKGVKKC